MSRKYSSSSISDKMLSGSGSGTNSRENMHASYTTSNDDSDSSLLNRFRMSQTQTQPLPPSHSNSHKNHNINSSGNHSHSSKLVHGSQFRMPQRLAPPCEQCDVLSNNMKKSKETIRSLKLQISRLEEKLYDKKGNNNNNDRDPATDANSNNIEYENLKNLYNNLVRKNKENENEISKMKLENHNNILQHEENQRAMQRTNQILHEELDSTNSQYNDIKDRCRELTENCNDKNQQILEFERVLRLKIEYISELEKELDFLKR